MDVKLSFDCFTPLILHSYHNPIVFQSLGVNVNLNLFYSFHSFSKSVGVYENFRSIVYGDFPWNWSFPFFPSFFLQLLYERKTYMEQTDLSDSLPDFGTGLCFTFYLLLVNYLASK